MGPDAGFILAFLMALAFATTNGFNDAANAIATLVATRVARPLPAVAMAAFFNLLGPLLLGSAVANTVGTIVDVPRGQAVAVIGAGLTGAVAWNLCTWWRGLPSSSSHALIGGLVGAAVVDAGFATVNWGPLSHGHISGVLGILIGLLLAVVFGFALAFAVERMALLALRRATSRVQGVVGGSQWVTSACLAFSHGSNDAQKTVGILGALFLATGRSGTLSVPTWVTLLCATMLTLGTALGGWTIVRTIGRRIFPLHTLDGLVSQASSAGVILTASIVGAPVSTSQVVSSSVVGIGIGRRRWHHVGWLVVRDIGVAWVVTMPAAAVLAIASLPFWRLIT